MTDEEEVTPYQWAEVGAGLQRLKDEKGMGCALTWTCVRRGEYAKARRALDELLIDEGISNQDLHQRLR